jgi:hypothetical protein
MEDFNKWTELLGEASDLSDETNLELDREQATYPPYPPFPAHPSPSYPSYPPASPWPSKRAEVSCGRCRRGTHRSILAQLLPHFILLRSLRLKEIAQ